MIGSVIKPRVIGETIYKRCQAIDIDNKFLILRELIPSYIAAIFFKPVIDIAKINKNRNAFVL